MDTFKGKPVSSDEDDLEAATVETGDLVGPYRLLRLIGEGASGRVFEVEHVKIARRAAMKVLSPAHTLRPGAVRRLLAEAQAVNRINHPHIVEITDVIEADRPGGVNAVVMELLEGHSLAQAMMKDGKLCPDRYVRILAQVADALAAAHAAGFVHRDLKPDNIFLIERDGRRDYVKLLDFGIAKSLGSGAERPDAPLVPTIVRQHATVEGTFLGTPAYASPEQASGKSVDHRTDIYSFGVIFYELVCGRLPFEGNNLGDFLVKHITMPPPDAPPEVMATPMGRALDQIVRRCLEKEPPSRFRSAGEVKDELERLLDTHAAEMAAPPPRRRPSGLIAGVAAVGIAAVIAIVALGGPRPSASVVAPGGAPLPTIEPLPAPGPARVALTFSSDPPGAETRRVGSTEIIGITPFVEEFPAGGVIELEMRKPGYEPTRFRVLLVADAQVGGPLLTKTRARPGRTLARRPAGKAPGAASKAATLNPFGE
jgi:serine/threonine protein kinase